MRSRLSRRDVELFADAVDGRATGERHRPAYERVRNYVDLADLVRESAGSTARPDFVSDLRAELMAAAADELQPADDLRSPPETPRDDDRAVARPTRLRRRLTAAASAFVVVGGTLGLVAASAQAMPGDMLYPVKRATERVELLLRDGSGEGRALLAHATNRLEEVEALIADGDQSLNDLVSDTLADFVNEANAGGTLLLEAYRDGGSSNDIEDLRAFTTASADRLQGLADSVPEVAAGDYAEAAQTVSGLDTNAVSACPTCADGMPPVDVEDELLAAMESLGEPAESTATPDGRQSRPDSSDRDYALPTLPKVDLGKPGDPDGGGGSNPTGDGPADDTDTDDGTGGTDGGSGPSGPSNETEDPTDDGTDNPVEDVTEPVGNILEPVTQPVQDLLEGVLGTP
jgi:Domain of unknown function (DUF5667)